MQSAIKRLETSFDDEVDYFLVHIPVISSQRAFTQKISISDYERVKQGKWLPDVCVNFMIKFIWAGWPADFQDRTYVCTNNVYQKLVAISSTTTNSIPRWIKRIPWFTKDFILLPIMEGSHWYLVILAYVYHKQKSAILVMDSKNLKRHHKAIKVLSSSLKQLAKHNDQLAMVKWSTKQLPAHYIEVPKQPNDDDCGSFMLKNVDMFGNELGFGSVDTIKDIDCKNWYESKDGVAFRRCMVWIMDTFAVTQGAYCNYINSNPNPSNTISNSKSKCNTSCNTICNSNSNTNSTTNTNTNDRELM